VARQKVAKRENYLAALSHFLARRVHLIDLVTLRNQLTSLERTVGAGDKETVTHPKHANAHDDIATAACGAVVWALRATRLAAADDHKIVVPFWTGVPRHIPGSDAPSVYVAGLQVPAPSRPGGERERAMDERAARDFEHMARINAEVRAETARVTNEPAPRWAGAGGSSGPSPRNVAAIGVGGHAPRHTGGPTVVGVRPRDKRERQDTFIERQKGKGYVESSALQRFGKALRPLL
jgi:hypothetical protein